MHTPMPTIKELVVPLEHFPHLGIDSSVHNAVALLFEHTVSGGGKLLFDELLVISNQDEYVGRLTIRSILACYFPSLFDGGQKEIFAARKKSTPIWPYSLKAASKMSANGRGHCR